MRRGKELYMWPTSCRVCHGENGKGRLGTTLLNGPTAADICDQIQSKPHMGMIEMEMRE
ncbi:MAG: hypothetical protein V3T18_03295 [Pseudomonadales bacterium]